MILPDRDKWNSKRDEVQYDPGFIAYLGMIFDPDRPVIDIGANVGKVARFLAKRTNQKIYCYEPAPTTYAALIENVVTYKNILCVKKAIGKESGKSWFVGDGTVTAHLSNGKRGATVEVDVITLNTKMFEDVGLIKIDVEGYELHVLHGCLDVISKFKPLIALEIVHSENQRKAIFDLLEPWYPRAVNKYGMPEYRNKSTGAADIFFLPSAGWYAPNLSIGYKRLLNKQPRGSKAQGVTNGTEGNQAGDSQGGQTEVHDLREAGNG